VSEQKFGGGGVLDDILSTGQKRISDLLRATQDLESGLASGRLRACKWAAVNSVFKEEKIREFKRSLEEIKTTLLLARQSTLE
jgi:hypothetical protein